MGTIIGGIYNTGNAGSAASGGGSGGGAGMFETTYTKVKALQVVRAMSGKSVVDGDAAQTAYSVPSPKAGSVRTLVLSVTSNTLNAATTVAILKNGVVAATYSLAASATGAIDTGIASFSVAKGDLIIFRFDASGSTTGEAFIQASAQLA